jgi:indole-3-glycerol phosphate synthase
VSDDFLERILERKRRENTRRARREDVVTRANQQLTYDTDRAAFAIARLRRTGAAFPKVIAEVKMKSPSAGVIRERTAGEVMRIARGYAAAGASAVSVLCDGPGFGGSPLDLRRVARAVDTPLLFKEFVLDPIQVSLARAMGADMVLLLVRALTPAQLFCLVAHAQALGLAAVVEVADEEELIVALRSDATIVGVNARDLRTFRVDPERARRVIEMIPEQRVAVLMSGIGSAQELRALGPSRADAILVGEALMRAPDPGARLSAWLRESGDAPAAS